MSIIIFRFPHFPQDSGDTWHLCRKIVSKNSKACFLRQGKTKVSHMQIYTRENASSRVRKYRNIIDNAPEYFEIFFFSYWKIYLRRIDKYLSRFSFYIQSLNFIVKYLLRNSNMSRFSRNSLGLCNVKQTRY